MAKLTWNDVGKRYYELGVDRGVLYVDDIGYAWNGLVSVEENPSGGSARAYYIDGVKYLNRAEREEFEATISAFYSPPEFDICEGRVTLRRGLLATQQRRKPFGFSYRSGIGNDLNPEVGYKIHIVYNALATPSSSRSYSTQNDSPEAPLLSWNITTTPSKIPGAAYSAHLEIDTTTAPPYAVTTLENILYGDETAPARLPTPDELVAMFSDPTPLTVTDNGDGTFTITGSDLSVNMIDSTTYSIYGDTVIGIDAESAEVSSE